MPIDSIANAYLGAITKGTKIDGGCSYLERFELKRLDFSVDSLKYIDQVLDGIHAQGVTMNGFSNNQANVNLAYLLAFYVGAVIERESKTPVTWFQYPEIIAQQPSLAGPLGEQCLGTSIMCRHGQALYISLSSILTRIDEGSASDKSVWYSAHGQIIALTKRAQPSKPWWRFW